MADAKNTKKKPAPKKKAVQKPIEEQPEQPMLGSDTVTENSIPAVENAVPAEQPDEAVGTENEAHTEEPAVTAAEENEAVDPAEPTATETDKNDEAAPEHKPEPTAPKQSGKKLPLSKNMIIILSCVLAAVLIAVILTVSLVSCKGGAKTMYTVTFDTRGGSPVNSVRVAAGGTVRRPDDPQKEMFSFDDWYWENPDKAGERQRFLFDSRISQDITLIAGWIGESSVKITYDPNGGAFAENASITDYILAGAAATQPQQSPSREGYLFGGWYKDSEARNAYDFSAKVTENITLYAGWAHDTQNYAYITYYGNGELLAERYVQKSATVELADDLFGSDLVVGEWYTDPAMRTPYTAGVADSDFSLYTSYYTRGLTFSANGRSVTGYNGTSSEVVVPVMYNRNVEVTAIGDFAFYRPAALTQITKIKLPASIVTVGNGAFYDCRYLTEVNLTSNVLTIGTDAFYRNERLRSYGDISGVRMISSGLFRGCTLLENIEIPAFVTSIGSYAFTDCRSIKSIEIPAAVTTVGAYAFSGCTALETVETSDAALLNSIGNYAFQNCTSLKSLTLAKSSAVALGEDVLQNCLDAVIRVPATLLETYQNNEAYGAIKDKFTAIG